MKLSWLFVIALLVFVAVFSVQNANVITVRFLPWEITMSSALVIQLAALLGALVGLSIGVWSRREKPVRLPAPERYPPVTPALPGPTSQEPDSDPVRIGPPPPERPEKTLP